MLPRIARRLARLLCSPVKSLYYGRIVTKEVRGVRYKLDLSETIDSALYFHGCYERKTSRALSRLVRPEMTVFEVGANVGAHTFEIAQMLDPRRGRVYSFEPTDYAFDKLKRNYELNAFDNIVLERIALSDTNEQREIHRATTPETMPFKASWDRKKRGPKYRSVDHITFRRLDDYAAEQGITRLDLIKIDVDGYEMRVLRGGLETLRRFRPLLIIELGVTLARVGDKLEDLIDTLTDLGYEFRSIENEVPLHRRQLLAEVGRNRTMDCVCVPVALSGRQAA